MRLKITPDAESMQEVSARFDKALTRFAWILTAFLGAVLLLVTVAVSHAH